MKLRVLIADDELLARDRLRQFIQRDSALEIVAECANGTEAVSAIGATAPDLVFLDVKMPELDGFGVIESLNLARLPAIIFVTAYDRFALQAFEVHAVDFLLKPFNHERFQMAVHRVRERLGQGDGQPNNQLLADLVNILEARSRRLERVAVRSEGRVFLINIPDIDWICAADNYAELHLGGVSHLLRMTIQALQARLPKDLFVRVSRSSLVNVNRIKEIRPKSHGDVLILLQNGTRLSASRTYRKNLLGLVSRSP